MEESSFIPKSLKHKIQGFSFSRRTICITASAVAVAAAAMFICNYSLAVSVNVDGKTVAYVSDKEVSQAAVAAAESDISDILGYDYSLDNKVKVKSAIVNKKNYSESVTEATESIINNIDEVSQGYVITIDGEDVGSVADLEECEDEMKNALESAKQDGVTQAWYSADISYEYRYAPSDLSLNSDELTAVVEEIPIETTKEVTYTEPAPYTIEYLTTDSLYEDDWEIATEGEKGEQEVTAKITYLDGEEESREILDQTTLVEPVTQTIYVGTADPGTPIVTGNFIWPTNGTITSDFGYRSVRIGSSNHKGIDIGAPSGTSIYAADGGVVIFAGTMSGYGNLVQIQHNDGVVTYYGHCSSLEVSVGDAVYQGQEIAKVGMTGTASGYHLHFEVRINDESQNPINYLP